MNDIFENKHELDGEFRILKTEQLFDAKKDNLKKMKDIFNSYNDIPQNEKIVRFYEY